MILGTLVGVIYDRTKDLELASCSDAAAVTLMSTDIDRITSNIQQIHELWASTLEVGLAIYLLQRQIGWAAVGTPLLTLSMHPEPHMT
jgi:ATP-binding cassette subfamily C (CFTR/MRP) protein 1